MMHLRNPQYPRIHASVGALVALTLVSIGTVDAAVSVGSRQNVQVGGFFSQGWLHASDVNFPTAATGGTWDFRESAVNVSTTVGSRLRVGAQAFAQRFGNIGEDRVILDWAVVDYNVRQEFGVRVGRVKYPKGLYGEALDLDVVRPYVFLPSSVYNPVLRDFAASFDGAMVYGSINAGRGSFDYKLFYGDIPISPEKGVAEFYNNSGLYAGAGTSALDMDSVVGGQLVWNTPVSGLRFAYSYSAYENLSTDGPFSAAPFLNLHSNIGRFSWNTVSAEYAWNNWTFAAEFQRSEGDLSYSAAPVVPLVRDDVGWDGWYVAASRRLGQRFEVGAYYGYVNGRFESTPASDPRNHKGDTAVSIRCDLNEHVTVKAEVHFFEGGYQNFSTPRIPNPGAQRLSDNTVFAAKTTFSF